MKRAVIAAAILSISAGAYAWPGEGNPPPFQTGNPVKVVVSPSTSVGGQHQQQGQRQAQQALGGAGGAGGMGGQGGTGGQGGNASNVGTNNATQTVAPAQNVSINNPRQTASAAPITIMPTAVCSGASSVSGQGAVFGFGVGTSWTDKNCMLLEQVRTVSYVLNDQATAEEMMCTNEVYAAARKRTGRPCTAPPAPATAAPGYKGHDPVVLYRLNH